MIPLTEFGDAGAVGRWGLSGEGGGEEGEEAFTDGRPLESDYGYDDQVFYPAQRTPRPGFGRWDYRKAF